MLVTNVPMNSQPKIRPVLLKIHAIPQRAATNPIKTITRDVDGLDSGSQ